MGSRSGRRKLRWADLTSTQRTGIVVLVAVEVVSAVKAWRDVGERTDAERRGPRMLWRASFLLNPGNSMLYWAFGRRRQAT